MQINIKSDNIITFSEKGNGKNVFIISPIFPFNNQIIEDFLDSLNINNSRFIFSDVDFSSKMKGYNFSLEEFLEIYKNLINSIDQNSKIIFVAFGVFSVLFSKLFSFFNGRVQKIIFFEPDFSNLVLMKLYDSLKKPLLKQKYLLNFYLNNKKENNINISKKNLKYLKFYYYTIKEHLEANKILRELIKYKDKIIIYWKVMEKDSWPLSQILQVEYDLPVITLSENIYDCFINGEKLIAEKFKDLTN